VSRPRFLGDHDLNGEIIRGVVRREPTIEFTPLRLLGTIDMPDPLLLELAARDGLIVVSHDVKTMRAHANDRVRAGLRMPGLMLAHQMDPIAPIIESLVVIGAASEAEEWEGQVVFLPL